MEQALADYAVLVTDLKIQFKATESKVVAFGGRYIEITLQRKVTAIKITFTETTTLI